MYAAARSKHPDGGNVAFVDGHVEFYTNEVDGWVWRALSTFKKSVWPAEYSCIADCTARRLASREPTPRCPAFICASAGCTR